MHCLCTDTHSTVCCMLCCNMRELVTALHSTRCAMQRAAQKHIGKTQMTTHIPLPPPTPPLPFFILCRSSSLRLICIQACLSKLNTCEDMHMPLPNMCAIAIMVLVTLQEVCFVDVDDKAIAALNKEIKRQSPPPTPGPTIQPLPSMPQHTPAALQPPPAAQPFSTIQVSSPA